MTNYMTIFVSYASKDKEFVEEKITLKFLARGMDIFWDVLSLRYGER